MSTKGKASNLKGASLKHNGEMKEWHKKGTEAIVIQQQNRGREMLPQRDFLCDITGKNQAQKGGKDSDKRGGEKEGGRRGKDGKRRKMTRELPAMLTNESLVSKAS